MTANFVFQWLQWGIDSNVVNDEGHTALEEVNLFTSSNASSEIKHILKGKFVISPKRKVKEGLIIVHLHIPVNNYIAKWRFGAWDMQGLPLEAGQPAPAPSNTPMAGNPRNLTRTHPPPLRQVSIHFSHWKSVG